MVVMRALLHIVAPLVACALCVLSPRQASAYSTPDAFADYPSSGGGGGRWFTGSPADGYGCSVCHLASSATKFPLLVAGLALDGYEPGSSREIVMSWPAFSQRWRELRPDPTQPTAPGTPLPAMTLVGELVAESGKASGTVEIRTNGASDAERCERRRPTLNPRVATRLYQVRPGVAPILIKADRNGIMRCESRQLGQRCIIAVGSCGAQQSRIVWKAPPSQEGPIWFSAGFVATDALEGTPNGDSVTEVAVPMTLASDNAAQYAHRLRGACSVGNIGARVTNTTSAQATTAQGGLSGWWMLLPAFVYAWLRRARRARAGSIVALLTLSLFGCGIEPTDHEASHYPNAGLYTPGSTLGASDPTDMPDPDILYGDRCNAPTVPAGPNTPGELSVDYETQTVMQRYAPKNVSVAWIETVDEQFVATLEISAALRRPGLVFWQERACVDRSGPDVVTSATKRDHMRPHSATWSGVDLNGNAMPDGEYVLLIEVTETDKEPGELDMFRFTKGAAVFDQELAPTIEGLASAHVTWMPRP